LSLSNPLNLFQMQNTSTPGDKRKRSIGNTPPGVKPVEKKKEISESSVSRDMNNLSIEEGAAGAEVTGVANNGEVTLVGEVPTDAEMVDVSADKTKENNDTESGNGGPAVEPEPEKEKKEGERIHTFTDDRTWEDHKYKGVVRPNCIVAFPNDGSLCLPWHVEALQADWERAITQLLNSKGDVEMVETVKDVKLGNWHYDDRPYYACAAIYMANPGKVDYTINFINNMRIESRVKLTATTENDLGMFARVRATFRSGSLLSNLGQAEKYLKSSFWSSQTFVADGEWRIEALRQTKEEKIQKRPGSFRGRGRGRGGMPPPPPKLVRV